MILSQDKYRDTQSENFYILCLFDFMLLSIENVDLIFMQCSHCEASCKKTCGSKHSAKPYMVLGLVYIFQSNSYLCINRKSTHSSNWYYIKGYVFEKILFKMTLKYQMLVLFDRAGQTFICLDIRYENQDSYTFLFLYRSNVSRLMYVSHGMSR